VVLRERYAWRTNKRWRLVFVLLVSRTIFLIPSEDAGALVFEADVRNMNMGDVIDIFPLER